MTYQSGDFLQSDYSQKVYPPFIDQYIADYDAAGRLPGFTNFNGTQTAYSYDNASRLTAINNQKTDNSVIAGYAFALDANGNRTHIAQEEPYAPSIGEGDATYTYNTQKNRLLSTSAEGSFGYDDEGQLQTGYSTDYTFDYEHRLKTIGGTQFYYDGGGKRLKANRSGVETRYIYDAGGTLLAEADANNNITQYYIYGNGLLAMVTPGDQTYCYHYNGIGSTTAMTNASQEIINKYSYDAFGNVASEQEAISQPFKYVGQAGVMTEPNGFYYMKARYYDPTVGRFISEDPIGFDGGDVNLMAYVGNNPVTGIDPSGLSMSAINDFDLGGYYPANDYNFIMGGVSTPTLTSPWETTNFNSTPNPYLQNSVFGTSSVTTTPTIIWTTTQNSTNVGKVVTGGFMMGSAGIGSVISVATITVGGIFTTKPPYIDGIEIMGLGLGIGLYTAPLYKLGWNTIQEGLRGDINNKPFSVFAH